MKLLRELWRRLTWNPFKTEPMTLRTLGYPSYEDLQSVGLSREEFYRRYVQSTPILYGDGPIRYSERCLRKFYDDYPQLERKVS